MDYKESVFDLIKRRTSWRSYDAKSLEDKKIQDINDFISKNIIGPFKNRIRLKILDLPKDHEADLKKMSTYGVIKGARYFLVGAVEKGENDFVDYGYCFEKAILLATERGLATCWLAGTFNRSVFSRAVGLSQLEKMPAISPIGYPSEKRNFIDNAMRALAGSHKRKKWDEIFFDQDFDTNLKLKEHANIADILEMVRIAPSASNKQPWRVVYTGDRSFHFYIERSKVLKMIRHQVDFQKLDIGIAMCHFDLCAKEASLKGSWVSEDPGIENSGKYEYVASWV
jgi:nitroreductase